MKSYRFLFNSMSPFSRKQVYGSEKNCNVLERIRKLDDHVAFYELLRLPVVSL